MYFSKPELYLKKEVIERIELLAEKHIIDKKSNADVTYVIGDTHGMFKYLLRLLEFITLKHPEGMNSRFVFLGDYVDRGSDVAATIATIRLLEDIFPVGFVIALMGNHEAMLLNETDPNHNDNLLINFQSSMHWKTYTSFRDHGFKNGPKCKTGQIPSDVKHWMANLLLCWEDNLHYYVHAGFNPEFPLNRQRPDDLIWIREEFLNSNKDFGKHVFHGHTPTRAKGSHDFRTNLDHGACFDGELMAAKIMPNISKPVALMWTDGKDTFEKQIGD